MDNPDLADSFVIYHSREDECWIAHSLRTDQIGTGKRIVDALADAIRAVQDVVELHRQDDSIALFVEPPEEIRKLVEGATVLPREIYELAYMKVHGTWPAAAAADFDIAPKSDAVVFVTQGELASLAR